MKLSIYTALFSSYLFNLCLHSHVMRLNHVEMLWDVFHFGPLFRKELDEFLQQWNHHRIHKNSMAECPGGIPEFLFNIPQCYCK